MTETETKTKTKASKIEPDAPRVSAELDGYDLSAATIERRIVRDGGLIELRVVVPLPVEQQEVAAEPAAEHGDEPETEPAAE